MTKTYWDELGPSYQFAPSFEIKLLVDLIAKDCDSVFEASVGTGIIPRLLREKGFEGRYLGSDYCDNFISHAQENNPGEEIIKVDLFEKIPLGDKSFDCSVVHHGLEYVYPYRTALEELKRISRKYVFITFWVDFVENPNRIAFTEEGRWNVNYYNRAEFFATLNDIGMGVQAKITVEDGRTNYLYILKP